MPKKLPRQCPVCGQIFQGNGWDGIDARWRASHEDIMPYEKFWTSLCEGHKSCEHNGGRNFSHRNAGILPAV